MRKLLKQTLVTCCCVGPDITLLAISKQNCIYNFDFITIFLFSKCWLHMPGQVVTKVAGPTLKNLGRVKKKCMNIRLSFWSPMTCDTSKIWEGLKKKMHEYQT